MRKFLSLFTVLMLSGVLAFSQNRTISGMVRDDQGGPVPFATVTETGTRNATTADANGNFVITQKGTGSLTFTAAGFTPSVVTPTGNYVTPSLSRNTAELSTVVVTTALGIKRDKNTLPYAAQQISGDQVSNTRSANAGAALSGKVSGLQITQGNGLGSSTNIVIRGNKSLTGSNQALFVVDGVPVDNSNTNSTNQRTGRGGYDYGNAAADINPDDIESLTVLKGAAASALYGSRATNGVIMITTKKARRGLGVTINSGVIVGKIDKTTFPTYQKEYGAGYSDPYAKDGFRYFDVDGDGVKDLVVPTSEDASFGAKYDPNLMVFHWDAFDPASPYYHKAKPWVAAKNDPSTFYETSITNNNSIMMDGASDKGSFKIGYTRDDEKGVLPNSHLLKNTVNFGSTYKLTDRLTILASGSYSNVTGKGRYGTGYSGRNVNQNFRQWYQTNVDIQEQKEAYFRNKQNISWNWADPSTAAGTVPFELLIEYNPGTTKPPEVDENTDDTTVLFILKPSKPFRLKSEVNCLSTLAIRS
jgi:TonB-dependent SusC/RagA subfamily outer membrane receptor